MENSDMLDRSEDEIALQGFCSPKRPPYRFLGLALMCLLGFGTIGIYTLFTSCPLFCFQMSLEKKQPVG